MNVGMRVLVTGANGFVGRSLVESLLDDNVPVRILTRNPDSLPERWSGRVEIAVGDLAVATTLREAVTDCGSVYHLAGEIRDPKIMWAVNKEGTERLLEASVNAGVQRFLYLSSVGVIGCRGDVGQVDDTTPPRPRNSYEKSKLAGEIAALRCHNEGGMCVNSIRPSTIYGENRNGCRDSFLAWVRLIGSERYVLFGRNCISGYVYVRDVVAACRFEERLSGHGGKTFIVNENISLNLFADEIASVLGVRRPWVLPGMLGGFAAGTLRVTGRFGTLCSRTVFSMAKLEQEGFVLPHGYRAGLRTTLQWYREQGCLR